MKVTSKFSDVLLQTLSELTYYYDRTIPECVLELAMHKMKAFLYSIL